MYFGTDPGSDSDKSTRTHTTLPSTLAVSFLRTYQTGVERGFSIWGTSSGGGGLER